MKKEEVIKLIEDLKNTCLSFSDLAIKYNVSKMTIYNINCGKTHKQQNLTYPIREKTSASLDEKAKYFAAHYRDRYKTKQLHLIIGKGTYAMVALAKDYEDKYKEDEELEKRRQVFDIITTPNERFISTLDNRINLGDMQYIKFLGRFGAPLDKIIELYSFAVVMDNPASPYPISTKEDIQKYLE